jgi:hypothetical protein
MKLTGNIQKMRVELDTPTRYYLPVGGQEIHLNPVIGKTLRLSYQGTINCIACGRETNKSFNQGYCFPCLRTLARCDTCIVRPELCHYHEGTCREPEWADRNCNRTHIVYLANSSGVKVGITRESQVPTRWIDQGASEALPILEVPDRRTAGLVEVALKSCVSDRTDWRRMLKGTPEPVDLKSECNRVLTECEKQLSELEQELGIKKLIRINSEPVQIGYPVDQYPERIKSFNLDKIADIRGTLFGIKGQYLIFEDGVINMRKYGGYKLTVEIT